MTSNYGSTRKPIEPEPPWAPGCAPPKARYEDCPRADEWDAGQSVRSAVICMVLMIITVAATAFAFGWRL